MRHIRDGEKGVRRWGERKITYTYHYTVTTRMTSALRWAAMRATRKHTGNIGTYSLTLRTLLASCRCSISSYPAADSCIKMGSYASHFNVSLIVRDKVRRWCLQTTTFEEKGELKRIWTEVLLLLRRNWFRTIIMATGKNCVAWGMSYCIAI